MTSPVFAPFPMTPAPRRLRAQPWTRSMVQEHEVTVNDLIWPVFICEGVDCEEPIAAMPGVSRLSVDRAGSGRRERCKPWHSVHGSLSQHPK